MELLYAMLFCLILERDAVTGYNSVTGSASNGKARIQVKAIAEPSRALYFDPSSLFFDKQSGIGTTSCCEK